jgi:hypothetical protein
MYIVADFLNLLLRIERIQKHWSENLKKLINSMTIEAQIVYIGHILQHLSLHSLAMQQHSS